MNRTILILLLLMSSSFACNSDKQEVAIVKEKETRPIKEDIPKREPLGEGNHSAEIVRTLPHSKSAFTQGLFFHNDDIIETTGQYTKSKIRRINSQTGEVINSRNIGFRYFGEGSTILNNKLFVLTWRSGTCFVLDPLTFNEIQNFNYSGEGWGLTEYNGLLVMSNGSSELSFYDPNSFSKRKTISVTEGGLTVPGLNELENVNGEIFANIWGQDRIIRIDPDSGKVLGEIDLSFLFNEIESHRNLDVLNGIAYNPRSDQLIVTGKNWDKMFEIKLK